MKDFWRTIMILFALVTFCLTFGSWFWFYEPEARLVMMLSNLAFTIVLVYRARSLSK